MIKVIELKLKALTGFINRNFNYINRLLLIMLLSYFAGRLVFYAFTINPAIPPDEVTHVGMIHHFAKYLLLPENTPESWELGLVTHISYMYYWLMGKIDFFWPFKTWDLIFLRLINALFCFCTVLVVWRLARTVAGEKSWIPILTIVSLTNTPMFSFLGAMVSYDNLTNLCAVSALYYFVLLIQSEKLLSLLKGITVLMIGTLSKYTLLPLGLFMVCLGIFKFRRKLSIPLNKISIKSGLIFLRHLSAQKKFWVTSVFVFLVLNVQLYGTNIIRFGGIEVPWEKVLTLEQCLKNRIFARNYIIDEFKKGTLSYNQAVNATAIIKHTGDRSATLSILNTIKIWKEYRLRLMDPITYAVQWYIGMTQSSMTIAGHRLMFRGPFWAGFSLLLTLIILVSMIKQWRPGTEQDDINYLIAITFAYAVFLLWLVNYITYLHYIDSNLAVQGRYIFPVIAPLWIFMWLFMSRLRFFKIKIVLTILIASILITGDFPYFLSHAGKEWFISGPH
jgi:hypothetical protein